jgi:hypothetical protein
MMEQHSAECRRLKTFKVIQYSPMQQKNNIKDFYGNAQTDQAIYLKGYTAENIFTRTTA